MIKGYETENQKLMKQHKEYTEQIKDLNLQLQREQTQVKEYQLKAVKEKKGVYVEEDDDEVTIMAKNVMGSSQAISLKELDELYKKLKDI